MLFITKPNILLFCEIMQLCFSKFITTVTIIAIKIKLFDLQLLIDPQFVYTAVRSKAYKAGTAVS